MIPVKFSQRRQIYDTPCEVFRKFGFSNRYRLNGVDYEVPDGDYIRLYSVITYVDIAYNEFFSIINDKAFAFIDREEERRIGYIRKMFHYYFARILYQKSEQGSKLIEFFDLAQKGWTEAMQGVEVSIAETARKHVSSEIACNHFCRMCRVFNYLELSEYMREALHYRRNDDEYVIIDRQVLTLLNSYIDSTQDKEQVIMEVANHFTGINRIIIPTFHNINIENL